VTFGIAPVFGRACDFAGAALRWGSAADQALSATPIRAGSRSRASQLPLGGFLLIGLP
jgi:hypothetical protein